MSKLDQAEAQVRRTTVLVLVMGLILVVALIAVTWLLVSFGGSAVPALMLVMPAMTLIPLGMALDSQRKLITALREELDQLRQRPGTHGGP
jgi:hypothetical protein